MSVASMLVNKADFLNWVFQVEAENSIPHLSFPNIRQTDRTIDNRFSVSFLFFLIFDERAKKRVKKLA